MRYYILVILNIWLACIKAQVYTVNTNDDLDDGLCDGIHCSLREAIKASEVDGAASTINFNIPGAGTQSIIPASPFPTVTQNDLSILGETQPGGAGTIVIDFNYRNFAGIGFWDVEGSNFYMSGINFTDFLFDNVGDHLLQFGSLANNSSDSRIFNCSFITDNSFNVALEKKLISVFNADNFNISNCNFGTDNSRSFISKLDGYIFIEPNQGAANVIIDSNIFVNKIKMIEWDGGNLFVSKNIFGALDTTKNANFLGPEYGIHANAPRQTALIDNNFFFGFQKEAIHILVADNTTISKNRFYSDVNDIDISGIANDVHFIVDNFARDGKRFLSTNGIKEVHIERNNINNYDTVFYNLNVPINEKIRHIDNRMTCINDEVIIMNPALFPGHPIPSITTVNRNQITGTGNPNDSIIVYSNNRIACPNAVCEGGVELGRTKANASGSWILNATYPNRTSISAFQFESNPNVRPTLYSEFSECYQCTSQVKINFTPSLCSGQTVAYRSKIYSELNPNDSLFVRGDGMSICDSVILVRISFNTGYRAHLDVPICFQDTVRFGSVIIHKDHLNDSLLLKSAFGCDSITTFTGREVGLGNFSQTICDNASLRIGNTVFDKNNPSGIGIIPGAAVGGCDSIVNVDLTINNFTESFLNLIKCPGTDTLVGGQLFNQARPIGDVTLVKGSSTGCDSVIHVNLLYPNNIGAYSTTICRGDSVFVINQYFSERNTTGLVTILGGSSFGCDSFINVNIGILPNAQGSYNDEICRGDTLNLNGELFFSGKPTGFILLANMATNGCDSTVLVTISVIPDAIGRLDTVVCENDSVILYGQVFSLQRPNDDLKIPDASSRMCDSFVNVRLTFITEIKDTIMPVICQKDSIKVGNQFFTANNPSGLVRFPKGSAAGCDSTVNVFLTVNPPIALNFQTNALLCNQANSGELILQSLTGGSGNFKISIDNQPLMNYNQGLVIGNLSQGNHTILISDQLSCDTTYNFSINNSQVLTLQMPNDTTIKKGNAVNVNALVNFNPKDILWDPSTYLSCDTCLNPQSKPDQTTTYMLTVTDFNDCIITGNFTITVIVDEADIYIPNAFSPNGDNVNDLFFPEFKIPLETSIVIFRIFDRWGNMVYERMNGAIGDTMGWDGKVNDEKLNPGVYVYAIQYVGKDNNPKWKTGDITLIR